MTTISPYINFNGNAEEAFDFYKSVFGGDFSELIRFKDIASDDFPVDSDDAEKIIRIVLPIGAASLIANDVPARLGRVSETENRSKIAVSVSDKVELERVFNKLSDGAEIEVEPNESPWGGYFAMLRDRYGIEWMVETKTA